MLKTQVSFLLLAVVLTFFDCATQDEAFTPQDHPLISAHTSGLISRTSPIRIVFVNTIADSSALNRAVTPSPLSFSPKINGTCVWAQRNVLEFRPDGWLPRNKKYTATVQLAKLTEILRGEDTFRFQFSTLAQSMDIRIDGLQTQGPELSQQVITGTLELADAENPRDAEEILSAQQENESLPITWSHVNPRTHHFTIENITRYEDSSRVNLEWNGSTIDLDERGERDIAIPGQSTFTLMSARAVYGQQHYIELRFSDPLQQSQTLQGLIRVPDHTNLTFNIEGNIVRVYSPQRFSGNITITIAAGIRNRAGFRLGKAAENTVQFEEIKPQVRFANKGTIVPTTQGLTIPIEAVNLRAVIVTATQIKVQNIPQFLQVNALDGDRELRRVGSEVWKDVIDLGFTPDQENQWQRYGLDLSPLLQNYPGGFYRLALTFRRPHVAYDCPEATDEEIDLSLEFWDDETDMWRQDYDPNIDWREYRNNRDNPCHPAYYRQWWDHNITVEHNVLISDIGLIAKRGDTDSLFVAVTDLQSTEPLSDVQLTVLDYQQNTLTSGQPNANGFAQFAASRTPYLLVAERGVQQGYLKLNDGSALPVSHFDVGGTTRESGLGGVIYGERGVWRPGDGIFLTFILHSEVPLPKTHPVRLEFVNPRGQLIDTQVQTTSTNGFYVFKLHTRADAPTGNWLARLRVGGATFEKTVNIETVMPNRLKINLDFGDVTELKPGTLQGTLSSTWLHGAPARDLKADIELQYQPTTTIFEDFPNYTFDDPTRSFQTESRLIFDGQLNEQGQASFSAAIPKDMTPAGQLKARLTTRVFEPGGAFSIDYLSLPLHPYKHYIGVHVPRNESGRDMLVTNQAHPIDIARLTPEGALEGNGTVEIKLYKIEWRWWWEKGEESLANYIGQRAYQPAQIDTVQLSNGTGDWTLNIENNAWGRYLLLARDLQGRHSSGEVIYLDWPGWRERDAAPEAATMLSLSADKDEYRVGETATISFPSSSTGRALVSLESGTGILSAQWVEPTSDRTQFSFKVMPDMAPNIYAHVTFVQPHLQTANDLPIRLYGVTPILVTDPQTKLSPVIATENVFVPETSTAISVSEENGRPMTYTLAVVDEGLLDLTGFPTPNPWDHFYSREALGVKTWDLYDAVAGAYGAKLERFLAIGGGEGIELQGERQANRFPPMVRYLGPFELGKNKTNQHQIDIPQYVGSVRVMVVAGHNQAFGAADKSVPVRKPLMVLGTLPRVLTVNERVALPVNVFALEESVQQVTVSVRADGPVQFIDETERQVTFTETGDKLVTFTVEAIANAPIATFFIEAKSGEERASHSINIQVRNPMSPVTDVLAKELKAGQSWQETLQLPGQPGTNAVSLEVSRIPPMNLQKRLNFLVQYPHGCVEQVTSAAFPQLYLNTLLDLPTDRQDEIEKNVKAGIEQLRRFQHADGGFVYWPGVAESDPWSTNYAGHFLVEAQRAGYSVPNAMLNQWKSFQKQSAQFWVTGGDRSELIQAYRLYTLALAGEADLASMNRLKERENLSTAATWRLAAAYQLAGQPEAARSLSRGNLNIEPYQELSNTYGSALRDKAMVLETLVLLDDQSRALELARELSEELSSDKWLSTQTTAYALIAMARFAGVVEETTELTVQVEWQDEKSIELSGTSPVLQHEFAVGQDTVATIQIINENEAPIFPQLLSRGLPKMGSETSASNGLSLSVLYKDTEVNPLDISTLAQGTDIVAELTVKNMGSIGRYEELALTHLVPTGWEIHNERLVETSDQQHYDYRDIRDDRIYTYFDLNQGESKTFRSRLNASYVGRFYQPPISVEAMYDATINARLKGQWITVELPGK